MNLDEHVRARLRALGDASDVDLDAGAQARIAARVAQDGPRTMRRARRQRAVAYGAGTLCAIGAVVWFAKPPEPQQVVGAAQRTPAVTTAMATAAPQPACSRRAAPVPSLSSAARDGSRIDLGAIGTIAVRADASAWLNAEDPCRIVLRLDRGRVDVHAADLAGGELRVATASGDVLVHGTQFSVEHAAGALTVEVDEGRVSVRRRDGTVIATLDAARRLRVAADGTASEEPLDGGARDAIRAAFAPAGDEPPARAPAERAQRGASPSTAELVAQADALWLQGERDRARDRYRKAGAQSGPTAEAAWLALARRELSAGAPAAASAAIATYESRFPSGQLAAEAAGIAFRAALKQPDPELQRRRAELLQRRHRNTPQAAAAERWLREHGSRDPR